VYILVYIEKQSTVSLHCACAFHGKFWTKWQNCTKLCTNSTPLQLTLIQSCLISHQQKQHSSHWN